jgi:hypothetical protein
VRLRRVLLGLGLILGLAFTDIACSPAAFADDAVVVTNSQNQANPTFHIDAALLTLLLGTVIPILVALVTKVSASSRLKAILNLVLSVAAGVLTAFTQAGARGVTLYEILTLAGATFVTSGVVHTTLWKPTGVAAGAANVAPTVGLGAGVPEP